MAQILATSPVVKSDTLAPRRLILSVIRTDDGKPHEYVIQKQFFYEDGSYALGDGNWFPVYISDPKTVQAQAWKRFKERADKELAYYDVVNVEEDMERFGRYIGMLTINTGKG